MHILMNTFQYYLFSVKLDRCAGSFNTLNDLSNKLCIPDKTEDLNLTVFNKITDISCECKSKFDGTKCNPDQWRNNDKC